MFYASIFLLDSVLFLYPVKISAVSLWYVTRKDFCWWSMSNLSSVALHLYRLSLLLSGFYICRFDIAQATLTSVEPNLAQPEAYEGEWSYAMVFSREVATNALGGFLEPCGGCTRPPQASEQLRMQLEQGFSRIRSSVDPELHMTWFHMEFNICKGSRNGIPTDNEGSPELLLTFVKGFNSCTKCEIKAQLFLGGRLFLCSYLLFSWTWLHDLSPHGPAPLILLV